MVENSNYDTFGRVLNGVFRDGLSGFVSDSLKKKYGDDWLREVRNKFKPGEVQRISVADDLDVAMLLKIILFRTIEGDHFRPKIAGSLKSWLHEIKILRNRWAHRGFTDMDNDAAWRALDTMHLVLREVGKAEEAESVRRARNDIPVGQPTREPEEPSSDTRVRLLKELLMSVDMDDDAWFLYAAEEVCAMGRAAAPAVPALIEACGRCFGGDPYLTQYVVPMLIPLSVWSGDVLYAIDSWLQDSVGISPHCEIIMDCLADADPESELPVLLPTVIEVLDNLCCQEEWDIVERAVGILDEARSKTVPALVRASLDDEITATQEASHKSLQETMNACREALPGLRKDDSYGDALEALHKLYDRAKEACGEILRQTGQKQDNGEEPS